MRPFFRVLYFYHRRPSIPHPLLRLSLPRSPTQRPLRHHHRTATMSTTAPPSTPTAPYLAEHATLAGPGDARPTALRIIDDDNLRGALHDKVMLVTGATGGIGVETVRALAATGARVFMTARDRATGEAVRKGIVERLGGQDGGMGSGGARVEVVEMELGRLESVRKAAEEVKGRTERLDVLVCNAGGFESFLL